MPRITHSDKQIHEAVGARIQQARRQRGLSQEQLAEALGIVPETVSRYETGSSPPSISTLHRLADALGVSVEALISVAPRGTPEDDLLARWRLLDAEGQMLLLDLLKRLVP